MTVWLLLWMLGPNQSFTIPHIVSQEECIRLGQRLSKKVNAQYECIPYKRVDPKA